MRRLAISSPLGLRTFRVRLFLLTLVSLKLPEVLRLTSKCRGVVLLGSRPRVRSRATRFWMIYRAQRSQANAWPRPARDPTEVDHAAIFSRARRCVIEIQSPRSRDCPGRDGGVSNPPSRRDPIRGASVAVYRCGQPYHRCHKATSKELTGVQVTRPIPVPQRMDETILGRGEAARSGAATVSETAAISSIRPMRPVCNA